MLGYELVNNSQTHPMALRGLSLKDASDSGNVSDFVDLKTDNDDREVEFRAERKRGGPNRKLSNGPANKLRPLGALSGRGLRTKNWVGGSLTYAEQVVRGFGVGAFYLEHLRRRASPPVTTSKKRIGGGSFSPPRQLGEIYNFTNKQKEFIAGLAAQQKNYRHTRSSVKRPQITKNDTAQPPKTYRPYRKILKSGKLMPGRGVGVPTLQHNTQGLRRGLGARELSQKISEKNKQNKYPLKLSAHDKQPQVTSLV